MSDLDTFLVTSEAEVKMKRLQAAEEQQRQTEEKNRLITAARNEWPKLLPMMSVLTKDKTFEELAFSVYQECGLLLGETSVVLSSGDLLGEGAVYKAVFKTKHNGQTTEVRISPCLEGSNLKWKARVLRDQGNLSTDELADLIIRKLVNVYREGQGF